MRLLDCYTELIAYTGYVTENGGGGTFAFEDVSDRYQLLIDRSRECARSAGIPEEHWQQGFFPVCAWIDERLICSGWPDRQRWTVSQLQKRYFNTSSAGDAFYSRLEALEKDAGDLREVFAVCLAMGFKGRYFRASDLGRREDIGYSNLKQITDNTDMPIPETLFPDAYAEAAGGKWRRKKWGGISIFSMVVFIIPVLTFTALFLLYNDLLTRALQSYFGAGV